LNLKEIKNLKKKKFVISSITTGMNVMQNNYHNLKKNVFF
jgi:hypothetical protein